MKFIHTADIHLDSVYSGLKSYYGARTLSIAEASQRAFVRLIDFALDESVDFIIIAGDLFDRNWKDYQQGLFMLEQIKRFNKPIFYIRGNHDAENRLLKKIPYPSNFIEFSAQKPETYFLEDLKVALHGQSYPSVKVDHDLSLYYPPSLLGYYNIGLLHSSGETSHAEKPYSPFVLSKLIEKGYQYWALGHLHDHHFLSKNPPVVYSGILQGRHIKETASKGFCLVEVKNDSQTTISFKETSEIIFLKIPINLTGIESEQSLKTKLLEELTTWIKPYSKSHQFVIRFIFEGQCCLKPSLYQELPHYQYSIHCWLEEKKSGYYFLERIENYTVPYRSVEEMVEEYPFLLELKDKIQKEFASQKIKTKYFENIKLLFDSSPESYKKYPFWAELEENEKFHSLVQKAELNVINRLLEINL